MLALAKRMHMVVTFNHKVNDACEAHPDCYQPICGSQVPGTSCTQHLNAEEPDWT